jgi:[ribosomal protein S5]-alanine N-acetyltransferase
MIEFEYIETPRLMLRKISPVELNWLFENCSEEDIKALLNLKTQETFEKEKQKYEKSYSCYNKTLLYFQIIDKASNQIVGSCGFFRMFMEHARGEVGYAMSNEMFKRRGIMSEALEHIIEYGFKEMNLNRIEAFVSPDNVASLKLMKKFKFVEEGMMRKHYFTDGEYQDSVVFSLLKNEYSK